MGTGIQELPLPQKRFMEMLINKVFRLQQVTKSYSFHQPFKKQMETFATFALWEDI